jgi:glycosyltransferase involved in cell wall biosynthesis
MPKVSVIIPNYNHSAYLNERINSVLSQSYTDFELILLADKSTDNSREIIELYRSNPVVKIVFNEVNSGGTFAQWNKGIQLCSGEYIWIAESDDSADKNFLSTLVPILDADKNIALVYSQSYDIDEKGVVRGKWSEFTKGLDEKRWESDFLLPGNEMMKKYMIYHNCIPNSSAVVFRKDKAKKVGGADETFKINGDWDFWAKLMIGSDVAYVSKCLNNFRTHVSSVRSKTSIAGIGLYEYARIIRYIFSCVSFSKKEKDKVILHFYNAWKLQPSHYRDIYKSYLILYKHDNKAILYLFPHIILRSNLYIRMLLPGIKRFIFP